MSRGGYMLPALRSGARLGDTEAIDMMVSVLTDPFGVGHMGVTAENLAEKWAISREEQDAFAVESQRRAAAAIDAGHFRSQIVPVVMQTRKGEIVFDTDEHCRPGTTLEALAKMKPAFKKDGTVTAGNASGINDGAAFLVLAEADVAARAGLQPMARLVSYALAGVPNEIMCEFALRASDALLSDVFHLGGYTNGCTGYLPTEEELKEEIERQKEFFAEQQGLDSADGGDAE